MAKLTFIYGTMPSGKTNDLIQTAYKYNSKGLKAILLKPEEDTKGNNKVVSRTGLEKEVDIILGKKESLFDYKEQLNDIRCLLVDEAQFLSEKQVFELFVMAKEHDVPVICYGIKTDFKGELFDGSKALFALADKLEKLMALCKTPDCMNNASFNARVIDGKYVYDGPKVLICDDKKESEPYDALCSECYLQKVLKPNKFKKMI